MNFAIFTLYFPYLGAGLLLISGLAGLVFPGRAARFWGVEPLVAQRYHGGLPLLAGAFLIYWNSASSYWSVGCGWLGLLLVRVWQWRTTGIRWPATMVELLIVISLLLGYFSN